MISNGVGCFLMGMSAFFGAADGPLGMDKPLRIVSVEADRTEARIFERLTLDITLEASYINPFSSREIRVDVEASPVGGEAFTVPAFLYQPFERQLNETEKGAQEVLAAAGEPRWQARLSFPETGRYVVRVTASDKSGAVSSDPVEITVSPADVAGMARTHPEDHRYFVTDRGETLYLNGANVCWGGARGTYNYDDWLARYAESNCNFFRVWLSPSWTTFAMNTHESGYDGIALGNAWRLDYVLEQAERLGLRIMICVDSFNVLRSKETLYGAWEESPYISSNGGPLAESSEYFTNETMLEAYRDRLRYLVARYGYSTSVFAWEFWNEVDIIDNYRSDVAAQWHADMARFLRKLDPWGHLITTSYARPQGDPNVDGLPELDFVQTHHYQAKDMALELGLDRFGKLAAQTKPHFHGEFGIDHGVRTGEMDPDGIHIHNGAFSSVGQFQAGIPMTWWWDSYVHPRNLYPIFGAFHRWIEGFDFVQQRVRALDTDFRGLDATDLRTPDDSLLRTDAASWEPAPWNEPTTVRITREGEIESDVPISRLLHGVRNHPDLHNPVTFEIDAPKDTTFGVVVEGVSGHGGAGLQIRVDGEVARTEDFIDTDEETATLYNYDSTYRVKLPKGTHTVVVDNPGNDWFQVGYEVPWLPAEPILRALGVVGDTEALVWIQNRAHTWVNVRKGDFDGTPVSGAQVTLEGFAPGEWRVDLWDTYAGLVASSETHRVGEDGLLTLTLPPIARDVAFRLHKTP